MMSDQHICPKCDKSFDSINALTGHTASHSSNPLTKEVKCDKCGELISRTNSTIQENNYCSYKCMGKAESVEPNYGCDECDKLIRVTECDRKNKESHFCSQECLNSNFSSKKELKCDYCTQKILRSPADVRDNNFCSHDCKNKWVEDNPESVSKYGEEHPQWKGGTSSNPYSKEFYDKREDVINRDDKECKMCGISRKKHKEDTGKDLAVHHIDANKSNNSYDNLATLCLACNVKVEFKPVRVQFDVQKAVQ